MRNTQQQGFTLLEILLVVAAIAILAGIVILAINPNKQLGDTRNAERRSDVNTMMNAIYQFSLDNNGTFPTNIDAVTSTSQVFGTDGSGCDSTCGLAGTETTACADVTSDLVATYISAIPSDPSTGTAGNTDYYVNKDANNRITIGACDAEQSATIEVVR
jgi:prepilin-type N-terminal cleavage/methylation domain-containing protein